MNENNILTDALSQGVSRRSFLKWSALVGGTAALAGGGLKFGLKPLEAAPANAATSQILTTSCIHNCGGRCLLRAEVKDGKIVRLVPDQEFPDTFERPRAIPCVRGRSQRRRTYSPERLKYPMKRVGKRGEGKFERISWDEALDMVARELTRIRKTYGNEAVYSLEPGSGTSAGRLCTQPVLRLLYMTGGCVMRYLTYSTACLTAVTPYITGDAAGNSATDLVNSKLIVLFGYNPMVTQTGGQGTSYYLRKAKEAGVKFIVIDPRQTDTVISLADQWIPIRPGTDVALIAALAYVMVKENLYDKEFMAKYTAGFDESNLPSGAPPKSSWMAYIMGEADGVAKTPEWAENVTGIPSATIVKLAREIAMTKPCAMFQGYAWQRRAYGEQPPRALPILAAMTGNFGIPGGSTGMSIGSGGSIALGSFPTGDNPVKLKMPCFLWPDFIERGPELNAKRDKILGGERLTQPMKFAWHYAGNLVINQHSDINRTIKILQDESKLEFLVVVDNMMTPSAKFADILLPETTHLEREDIVTGSNGGQAFAAFSHKLIEPMFETRDVLWMCEQLADRLGVGEKFRAGHKTREDWLRDMVEEARKKHADFPAYEQFKAVSSYKLALKKPVIAFADFRADPVKNPLKTETGKIEIFSPTLFRENNPQEIPAIPKYIPEWEGWEDPLRAKYPLLLFGAHAIQRAHSTFDNVDILQEAHPQALEINTLDAEERGIKNGDLVKVFNDRGATIVPAHVTPRIMPGVTSLPQGAWYTPDAKGIDRRGSINVLTKYQPTPFARGNPQHTNLVQVEKVEGEV